MYKLLFLFPFLLSGFHLVAQMGCTDPQANNYDANASINDGSCTYPSTLYTPVLVRFLTDDLQETSGLTVVQNEIWTHNDSGGEAALYTIDTLTGGVENTCVIDFGVNHDWEDLAADDTHIYIGDFGNNGGNRTDLTIYKILKTSLNDGIANAEKIHFTYEDQVNFDNENEAHNFDCEAFFVYQDSLHLFSKNWLDQRTNHYTLPLEAGTYEAQLSESFNTDGLVTSADIDAEGNIVFLGYTTTGNTFMWLLFDYKDTQFFSGNKRRIALGSAINNSQAEGIAFHGVKNGYISAEEFTILPPKLSTFSIADWLDPMNVSTYNLDESKQVQVFPNPFRSQIHLKSKNGMTGSWQVKLQNTLGQTVFQTQAFLDGNNIWTIDVDSYLPKGSYFLSLQNQKSLFSLQLQKY